MSVVEEQFYYLDLEKCTRCGKCVNVCPVGCFVLNSQERPELGAGKANYCIGCGHCVAVCPHGALNLIRNRLEKQTLLLQGSSMKEDELYYSLARVRSIRRYQDKTIPKGEIEKVLDISRYAPTAVNNQGVEYIVFSGRERVKELSAFVYKWMREMLKAKAPGAGWFMGFLREYQQGNDKILWNAPVVVLAAVDKDNQRSSESDPHIALTYISILAHSRGLGSCWAGYLQWCARVSSSFHQYFKINENLIIKSAIMLGYPEYEYQRIPERNKNIITWLE